jgi:tyrosine-protein kinase Etk/Wzc
MIQAATPHFCCKRTVSEITQNSPMTPEAQQRSEILTDRELDAIPYEETIDSWGVLLVLVSHWRWIASFTVAGIIAGVILSLVLKPTFTAEAIIVPPQQSSSSASALMGQLGMMTGLSGAAGLGIKSPADMYIGILQSRTIADNLISRFQLKDLYRARTFVDARAALLRHVKFESGKDNLIHIIVKDGDPRRASDIANGFLDELYKTNAVLVTDEAGQRRLFYDRRLADEKDALERAESELKDTQQKTGLIQLNGQTASIINSIAQARAEVASREVELQSILTYGTPENPDAVRVKEEIASLKAHLANLENSQRTIQPGDIQVPTGQLPEAALQYERQTRELKYHETLYDLLSRQAEAAHLDEVKSAPIIQVVDRAIPPDKKSGPPRTLITLGSAVFGFFFGCLLSLAGALYKRMKGNPEGTKKLNQIRAALGFR